MSNPFDDLFGGAFHNPFGTNNPDNPFEGRFGDATAPKLTEAQKNCNHFLASQMPDGKWFCPQCQLVSSWPLRR